MQSIINFHKTKSELESRSDSAQTFIIKKYFYFNVVLVIVELLFIGLYPPVLKNIIGYIDENNKNRVILMTTKASKVYTKFKFKRNDILLFGRESAGVPEDVHSKVNERIKIPMLKNKRSLNI